MRGTSSRGRMHLRSGGFKCSLCGRRVVDAALLERHLKTIHNIPGKGKKIVFKAKPKVNSHDSDNAETAFDKLLRSESLAAEKPKTKAKKSTDVLRIKGNVLAARTAKELKMRVHSAQTTDSQTESVVNNEVDSNNSKSTKKWEGIRKKAEFQCPVCSKMFNLYHTAHRHIQRYHSDDIPEENESVNSQHEIQPIRIEECIKCSVRMKSSDPHTCQYASDDSLGTILKYVCASCSQSFISLKTFDIHVAGLHSNGVESLFFPTELEFTNWRLEMERQTEVKYSSIGDYDSKKVFRCNYARKNERNTEGTTYYCPSAMIVQNFSKGIQVHFYQEHCDHPTKPYTLASKYINYSITTYLKNPGDLIHTTMNKTLSYKDLYSHFKVLMDGIVTDAMNMDVPKLKLLIEKALDMTEILTVSDENVECAPTKSNKAMTDKEITEELEVKGTSQKRRRSVDDVVSPKRTRNQLLIGEAGNESPKIVNTYILATNSDGHQSEDEEKKPASKSNRTLSGSQSEGETNSKSKQSNKSAFIQSPTFNDSYKDFIDKTIKGTMSVKGATKRTSERLTRSTALNVNLTTDPLRTAKTAIDVPKTFKDTSTLSNVTANVKKVEIKEGINEIVTAPRMGPKKICNVNVTRVKTDSPILESKYTKVYTPIITRNNPERQNSVRTEIEPDEATPLSAVKVKDLKYEVREQENDCNILVLKI